MGNQSSTASREMALNATLPVRKVCDQILEHMLKEINIKDFYLMATKQECSRYVIFLANQMSSTFRSLRFAPARGAAGMLFFQPIDILQKPTAEQQAERQSLCLFLAYFFVRIFQIYGALSLTLIDDANVFVQFKNTKGLTEEQRAFPYQGEQQTYGTPGAPKPIPTPFQYLIGAPEELRREGPINPYRPTSNPLFRLPSEGERPITRDRRSEYDPYDRNRNPYDRNRQLYDPYGRVRRGGGFLSENELGKFKFLKYTVTDQNIKAVQVIDQLDYKMEVGYSVKGMNASFKLQKDDFQKTSSNRGSLYIQITADRRLTRFYEVNMEVIERSGTTMLKIVNVRYQSLRDEAITAQQVKFGRTLSNPRSDIDGPELRELLINLYGANSYGELAIESGINDTYVIDTKNGQQEPSNFFKSLKETFDIKLGFRKPSDYRDLTRRDERLVGEINKNLDIQNVLVYLQQKKPLAHCVARGLQLLGNRDPTTGIMDSAICRTKFLISKKEYEEKITDRGDVPAPGGKIADMGGIQALSNLFYDTIRFKSNNLTRSHKAMNDYIVFMKKMAEQFLSTNKAENIKQSYKSIESLQSDKEKEAQLDYHKTEKLESITDERMAEWCAVLKDNFQFDPKTPAGKEILRKVGLLFGRQVKHAANCGNIFRQLFTTVSINGIVSVRINKLVYMKGVLELNRINDLARNLLIQYYDNCETIYREGVIILHNTKKSTNVSSPDGVPRRGGATRKRKSVL